MCLIALLSLRLEFINQDTVGSPNTSINYTSPVRQLSPRALGMDVSGYGYPNVFVNDPLEQRKLKMLGVKYMRMDLKYSIPGDPTSKIVCAGESCDIRWTGDQWIQAIQSIGAEPVVIVHYSSSDAANMVKHFNRETHNAVHYWIVGNEPDLQGMDVSTYSNHFNQDYDAMKAIDPTIKIGGGTTAWYDTDFLQTFLQRCGSRIDFVDFHHYAQKGDVPGDYDKLFQDAAAFTDDINNLRSLIQKNVPARAADIGIQVGEWELNWGGNAQDDTNFHAVWAASVMGHIVSSGAYSLFYADKGNALYSDQQTLTDSYKRSVHINVDDTKAAYHGIGMFTGEGLFPGFGDTLVEASTKLPDVEIYASDNPKNIVLINKSRSIAQTAIIKLNGVTSGSADIWRKDETVLFPNPPVKLKSIQVHSSILTYQVPPFSVTTLILHPMLLSPFASASSGASEMSEQKPELLLLALPAIAFNLQKNRSKR